VFRPDTTRKQFYLSGEALELWENEGLPFGWSPEDLQAYADRGAWELLFNALVLNAAPEPSLPSVS